MRRTIAKNQNSLKFVNSKVKKVLPKDFCYKVKRNECKLFKFKSTIFINLFASKVLLMALIIVKMAKEKSKSRAESGVKRSLYKRIRMERARNPHNLSVWVNSATTVSESLRGRKPFNKRAANESVESKRDDKYEIKQLENKIKALDYEIYGAKGNQKHNRSSSISTHETKFDSDNQLLSDCVPESIFWA